MLLPDKRQSGWLLEELALGSANAMAPDDEIVKVGFIVSLLNFVLRYPASHDIYQYEVRRQERCTVHDGNRVDVKDHHSEKVASDCSTITEN